MGRTPTYLALNLTRLAGSPTGCLLRSIKLLSCRAHRHSSQGRARVHIAARAAHPSTHMTHQSFDTQPLAAAQVAKPRRMEWPFYRSVGTAPCLKIRRSMDIRLLALMPPSARLPQRSTFLNTARAQSLPRRSVEGSGQIIYYLSPRRCGCCWCIRHRESSLMKPMHDIVRMTWFESRTIELFSAVARKRLMISGAPKGREDFIVS